MGSALAVFLTIVFLILAPFLVVWALNTALGLALVISSPKVWFAWIIILALLGR